MTRAAAILIVEKKIALIKRCRAQKTYFVFPGGTVEPEETVEAALIREVEEELGLHVHASRLVAEVLFKGVHQWYYLVEKAEGIFGTGQGPEMGSAVDSEAGSYTPLWMPVEEILDHPVLPREIAALVQKAGVAGWPTTVLHFDE